ncbi:hypothetical protein I6E36_12705 [Fusobacterium mortiferum]|uniref:hypothetical protein n=1 Tax=Fusobacterium mortiferum TaxID=850 RepID=UPI001F228DB2|nr:hypothetical protein [Fusobacterium mortiferum]MCF2628938.1 hypothetical protein [Fusobacterium mortiferum]
MGRLILTDNDKWKNKLEYNFKTLLNLKEIGKVEEDYYLKVFQKKKVNNENFYKNENNIIVSNGTFFYKEMMNKEALEQLLTDFKQLLTEADISTCIKKIRKNMIGSYLIFIKIGNIMVGFVDETSMYPCYYYNKNSYIVTNTYYNIAECIDTSINTMAVLENGICSMIVGNETPFKNIYRLLENEYILIKSNKLEIKNVEVNKYVYKFENYTQAVSILKKEIEKIAKIRAKYIKKTLLFTTGGLDSRMELALHNLFNDELVLGYWSGKDIITNGTVEDLNICKQLSECVKSEFKFFDVSYSFENCIEKLTDIELSKYGEYACIYAHNPKWLEIPEKIKDNKIDSIGFGALNEIIRETSQIDILKNNITLNELVLKVKMRSGLYDNVFLDYSLIEYIANKLKNIFKLDTEKISLEKGVNFFNRNRLHSNTIVNNYINLFYYDFNICGQKNIVDLIESIPYIWRQRSKIVISLTKEWNKNLLAVPYFSHHKKVIYDEEKGEIIPIKFEVYKENIKKILKNTIFYELVFELYQKIKSNHQKSKKEEILKLCNNYLKNSKYISDEKINIILKEKNIGFDLAALATMIAEIKLIDLYKNNRNK